MWIYISYPPFCPYFGWFNLQSRPPSDDCGATTRGNASSRPEAKAEPARGLAN